MTPTATGKSQISIDAGAGDVSLYKVMQLLKKALPYNFRFSGPETAGAKAARKVLVTSAEVTGKARSVDDWMGWLSSRLPEGWSIVPLPGYIIGYATLDAETVPSRTGEWRRVGDEVVFTPHVAQFESGPVDLDEDDENMDV